jgi:hypothetical protein
LGFFIEVYFLVAYVVVYTFDVLIIEWRLPIHQLIDYDAKAPDINLFGVLFKSYQFWRHV